MEVKREMPTCIKLHFLKFFQRQQKYGGTHTTYTQYAYNLRGLWVVTWLRGKISTSNRMFKREIWNKFTEFTFLKFWNLKNLISKFQKMSKVNFLQISRINMWFLVNHMWQALKEHTRVRITQKNNQSISTNLINITP